METGAGLSTVAFALLGANHMCITPEEDEIARILIYCHRHGIDLDEVEFINDRSDAALPGLQTRELDLVLIDGNHAFPTPFIDYHYASQHLRVGGHLIVDDVQLWTGRVLRDFLVDEPEWQLHREFARRASCFTKVDAGGHSKWWGEQPYVRRRSTVDRPPVA